MSDKLDSVKRCLQESFKYLMRDVLCFDLSKHKRKTYYIDEVDQPIIQEILLRSVSEYALDEIIVMWLRGQIRENDYNLIVELDNRLSTLICNVEGADEETKNK